MARRHRRARPPRQGGRPGPWPWPAARPRTVPCALAADLLEQRGAELLEHNAADLERRRADGASAVAARPAAPHRATGSRAMADGLRQVAALADPVGEVVEGWVRPNGLRVERVRVPLGVVGIIYENRPNVTSDAAGLCLKAGNATMLRGSSTAVELQRGHRGLPARGAGQGRACPRTPSCSWRTRAARRRCEFMRLDGVIDCLDPPRGALAHRHRCASTPRCPYVIDGDGNCHVYVDAAADLDMALSIVVNAKTQRPGVCNAAESLLVHEAVAAEFLPRAARGHWPASSCVGDDAQPGHPARHRRGRTRRTSPPSSWT